MAATTQDSEVRMRCTTCWIWFDDRTSYEQHFEKKRECMIVRDSPKPHYKKPSSWSLDKRRRVVENQIENVSKGVEDEDEEGNKKKSGKEGNKKSSKEGNKKKSGNTGRKGQKNKKK